ncbi:glycosyltransferase WbuB [Siminovitchia acidinfaciens]|uniref:Glycosyltransferase WbuB n=1 Tax=Siminovitchia acidinfaciens TaxID=2321395 RepID=A0A429XZG0_9BACI|nr:glycosyltransferase family 4 protein [Siminovitchia acidinfaciens]RST74184.1 glycosyltransferase WbuB [Siminovitchia acidinfaciens]
MNIWIFNHYARTPKQSGGTRHFELASYLVKKGCSVTIFASSFSHNKKEEMITYNSQRYQVEYIDGVKFVWLKTIPYKNSLKRIMNFISYSVNAYKVAMKDFKDEKVDLIIGSTVHPLAALAAYFVSKKLNAKFYFEERDLWPQTFIDFGKLKEKSLLSRVLFKVENFLYQKADKIIVLFNKATDYVVSKGVERDKVIYLPNGVNTGNHLDIKPSPEVDKIFREINNRFIVIYTGSHGIANHLKPILDLAKTTSKLDPSGKIHFLLVGNGPVKKDLIKGASDLNLKNISFADPVKKSDIPYLLSKADASYISIMDSPLYKWGFSMNKLYDYMAAGLPIFMYSNPAIVGEYSNLKGAIVSNDNVELAEQIVRLSNDSQMIEQMNRSLKVHVEENYSWNKLGQRFYNEFQLDKWGKYDSNKKTV